jgi:hypothetical protein
MKNTDIFYQAEDVRDIGHIEMPAETTFGEVKKAIAKKHGLEGDCALFLEDAEEATADDAVLSMHGSERELKVHVHRCREVKVGVTFNGKTVHHVFSPATTIAKVKKWAAEKNFGMTPEEAGEHVLQIAGTKDRPAPNVHIGTLAKHPRCHVEFDLVPDERINGSPERKA